MEDRATVFFENLDSGQTMELDIPLEISANDLILSLNSSFDLKMDIENIFHTYLVSENPIAFLRGNKTLAEFGIHNGTKIIFKRG